MISESLHAYTQVALFPVVGVHLWVFVNIGMFHKSFIALRRVTASMKQLTGPKLA